MPKFVYYFGSWFNDFAFEADLLRDGGIRSPIIHNDVAMQILADQTY